jgi:phosphoenolpyruvate carboxykinase (ATP)
MKLSYTRALVRAALAGQLDDRPTYTDAIFGLAVPTEVPGVPSAVMRPRDTWRDAAAFDAQAKKLAEMFRRNFEKFGEVDPRIAAAAPK